MKKLLPLVLTLACVAATLTSCGLLKNNVQDEWVLIYEDHIGDVSIAETNRTEYGYDEQGRLNYKKYTEDISDPNGTDAYLNCEYSDFIYDDSGNVTSYTEERDGEYTYYTFTYDEDGNCLSSIGTKEREDYIKIYTYTAEYDKNQNVIKEKNVYTYNGVTEGYMEKEYTLYYENDVCVYAEVVEAYDIGWLETELYLEKYFYDENGNITKMELYYLSDETTDTEINGKYYSLEEITIYTWKKLSENTSIKYSTVNITDITEKPTEIITEIIDDSSEILCEGVCNDNTYKLVMKQIDEYPSSYFQIGVIKNSEWLVELSSDSPFIDNNGRWKGLRDWEDNTVSSDNFTYIGVGCFFYENSGLVYNPESGVYFENICEMPSPSISSTEFIGCENRNSEGEGIVTNYYNLDTGEIKSLAYFQDENIQRPDRICNISEGLFYAEGDTLTWENFDYVRYCGFFDVNGNMILDLSEYKGITSYHGYEYENGEYTITCKNDSGVKFDITFNTSGEIIKQEKSSEQSD